MISCVKRSGDVVVKEVTASFYIYFITIYSVNCPQKKKTEKCLSSNRYLAPTNRLEYPRLTWLFDYHNISFQSITTLLLLMTRY